MTGLLRGLRRDRRAARGAVRRPIVEAEVLAEAIPGLNLHRWSPQVVRDHVATGTWYVATQLMLHPIPLDPIPSMITQARLPVAAVMYDVIPYRFPEQYQVEPNARRQAQLRAPLARTVDAMLAISQFSAITAADELDYPLERIRSIGAGVEDQFATADRSAVSREPIVCCRRTVDRYVVSVTGGDERKNTEGLLPRLGPPRSGDPTRPSPRDRHGPFAGRAAAVGGLGRRRRASATRSCSRGASPTTRWSPSCRRPNSP